jgi:nucleoside-diphosphate-sugar epimerase
MIAECLEYNKPISYEQPRPGDVRRHVADISLAGELIDFKPIVSFEEGLESTIEWYKENLKN